MSYDLYYFIKNCIFTQKEQQIGPYILSSAPGLQEEGWREYLNRYIKANPFLPKKLIIPDENWLNDYRKRHPVTLIRRLNYEAESVEAAFAETIGDIRSLCDLLSLERVSMAV